MSNEPQPGRGRTHSASSESDSLPASADPTASQGSPQADDAHQQDAEKHQRTLDETRVSPVADTDPSTLDLQRTAAERSTPWGDPSACLTAGRRMPERVSGYRLQEEIARGGMGVVYRARQVALQRTVALKMILAGSHASADDVQRFFSEAQAAAQLNHPAIVPIYEVGQWQGSPYFSMEYVEGRSLAEITRERPLTPRRAAEYLVQVADAIEYAHQVGILHRDLKPGNVLLNGLGQVKVTDFGLAKQVQSDSEITASGAVLGTPSYMPPEQALGMRKKIGPASDVYSMGAMLYALLAGRPPFQAASTAQTLLQVINLPPVSLRELDAGIPRDLETICGKCLEKEPSARYSTAADMAADLRRFLAGEPIRARRANVLERSLRWCRRNPIGSALITSLAVAVILCLTAVYYVMHSRRLERLNDLQSTLTARIDQPMLGAAYVQDVMRLRQQVDELNREQGSRMQTRFKQSYADYLRQQIEQPRLDDEVRLQIAESLAVMRERESDSVWDVLDDLLASSASRWESVASLEPPFANFADIFRDQHVFRLDDRLYISPYKGVRYPSALTRLETRGDVLIEAEFADGWQHRRCIGIAVDCIFKAVQSEMTFELLVHAPRRLLSQPITEWPTMGTSADSDLQLEIVRQGIRLASMNVPKPTEGPLRVVFRREGRHLELTLNQNPPLEVEELFPVAAIGESATLAILDVPEQEADNPPLPLGRLKLARRRLPPEPHPLEIGDLAFAKGDFVTALDHFQNRSADWPAKLQTEAKYKAALALIQLRRDREAKSLLEELAGQEAANWRFRAYAQLWILALQENELDEAELIAAQMLAEEAFDELVMQLPRETITKLVSHYRSFSPTNMDDFSLPPERLAEMERATLILTKLGAPLSTIADSYWDLAYAYLMSDHPQEALNLIRRTLTEFPHSAHSLWGMLNLYASVLRTNGVSYEDTITELRRHIFAEDGDLPSGGEFLLEVLVRHHLAEQDPKPVLEILQREDYQTWIHNAAADAHAHYLLLLGMALELDGNRELAQQSWSDGLQMIRNIEGKLAYSTVETYAILGGLTEDIVSEDIPRMMSALTVDQLGGPVMDRLRQQFISNAQIASIIRYLYRGKDGRDLLRIQFLSSATGRDSFRLIGQGIALEIARQMVCGMERAENFKFSPELGRELREYYDLGQQEAWNRKIGHLQATQAAMTFQGVTGFLGWAGLRSNMPKQLQSPLGFILGSHLVNVGKVDPGRIVLQDSLELAPQGSALRTAIIDKLQELDEDSVEADESNETTSNEGEATQEVRVDEVPAA